MPDATKAPSSNPVGVDTTRASIARVYDAALNGKDNFEIDREVLRQVAAVAPQVNDMAWSNRNFLIRACRFLAGQAGITQYLDCGSGLPTAENTHQVVQRLVPEAKVLYIDNDPVVLAHGRALLEENENTLFVSADIFDPDDVLSLSEVNDFLDFSKPIAVIQNGTFHHYIGDDGPQIMQKYVDAVVPGSYTVIAHFYDPETPEHSEIARKMEEKFVHSPMGSGVFRTREQLLEFFPDQELVPPGLALCDDWWPDGPRIKPLNQVEECIAGAVGRKVG
jgi:SAM-dependent methyltransferase